uniref:Uncharacterized protein n=1 Tax=Arundo donax TaxID=35708 RepID=A0A0A9HXT5_ARUDO
MITFLIYSCSLHHNDTDSEKCIILN